MNPPLRTRRRRRRGAGPLVAAASLLAGAVGAAGTLALWNVDGVTPAGRIVAGDLAVELVGTAVWQETSPDVPGAPRRIDPADFLARPGDTVTVQQRFTTELRGDNLRGVLAVDWREAPALPAGTTATYTVRDDSGAAVVADVPVGDAATLPTLDADHGGRADVFALELTLALAGSTPDRFGATAPEQVADLGAVVLTLDQVRPGEGAES